eukprot:2330274-Prymnesium_polylepis.1
MRQRVGSGVLSAKRNVASFGRLRQKTRELCSIDCIQPPVRPSCTTGRAATLRTKVRSPRARVNARPAERSRLL